MSLQGHDGIAAAVLSALLFGVSTPLAKLLVAGVPPVALAGLLYLGSGVGLMAWRWLRQRTGIGSESWEAPLARADWGWMAGAILSGGVIAPVLLMFGLTRTPGSAVALLLNLEGVFTAVIAWFVFRENVDRRVAAGFFLIVGGGVLLSWEGSPEGGLPLGGLLVVAACLGWAIDNNLTQRVSGSDPVQIAGIKGLVAGCINLTLAGLGGWDPAPLPVALAALGVGFLGYGVSLSLFVWGLRRLGTARTGAYFSIAPFIGVVFSLWLLHETPTPLFWIAGLLMAAGVWLHLTERHEHLHEHGPLAHAHRHVHDEHHRHEHPIAWDDARPHTHFHVHERITHRHPHYPDIHHRHDH